MKRADDDRAATIKGVITLPDGSTSEFSIFSDGGWQQWGATKERTGRSVPLMDAMVAGLLDESLLVSDSDEDYEDDQDDQDDQGDDAPDDAN